MCVLSYVIIDFYKKYFIIIILLYMYFFHENYFYFFMFRDVPSCSGMFRHVPECSVFRVLSTANCLACELTAHNACKNAEMNLKSTTTN